MGGLVEPIPGHPEYLAAWDGTIFSAKTGKARAGNLSRGRRHLKLHGSNPKSVNTARLVALAFLPPPKDGDHADHADGDKGNENIWNLRWLSPSQNQQALHDRLPGHYAGERNGQAKLTAAQVQAIRDASTERGSGRRLASEYGVSEATISMIRGKARW